VKVLAKARTKKASTVEQTESTMARTTIVSTLPTDEWQMLVTILNVINVQIVMFVVGGIVRDRVIVERRRGGFEQGAPVGMANVSPARHATIDQSPQSRHRCSTAQSG
jgi:hypothetical protein